MNSLQKKVQVIDNYQRKHLAPGFIYAVIKKYGDDNGSYLSSIITYYMLLSLFPLLLIFSTLTELVLNPNSGLGERISNSVYRYIPVIGDQVQASVHNPKKAGFALLVSLLITFYGAQGGAGALQFGLNSIWHIPPAKRPPFPKSTVRSFGIVVYGGLGFITATVLAGYTAILGHSLVVKLLSMLISALILWGTFIIIFKLAIAGKKSTKDVALAALLTAIGIQLLQTFGSTILAHEIKSLRGVDGTFALVIVLMFWIYLQAEVILYGMEIQVVKQYGLFPRSIQSPQTDADKSDFTRYAKIRSHSLREKGNEASTET